MYTRRTALACLGVSLITESIDARSKPSYETDVQHDRNAYSKEILGSDGPLTGVAAFTVHEGKGISTVGTDASCSCVFSSSGAPAHLGDLTVGEGKAKLDFAPGLKFTIKGQAVSALSAKGSNYPRLSDAELGDLTVTLSYNPAKLRARLGVWDSRVVKVKRFADPKWFPIDPKYRVVANWIAFQTPKTIILPDSNGESREWKSPGLAEFDFHGQRFRLTPIENPGAEKPLFFVFGDSSNGHQTYGGGRFLYAAAPKAGRVTLEFNMATNPMCAYNHRMFICPSPHRDNRLAVPILAGEQTYTSPVL